jgi:hypothetical protein
MQNSPFHDPRDIPNDVLAASLDAVSVAPDVSTPGIAHPFDVTVEDAQAMLEHIFALTAAPDPALPDPDAIVETVKGAAPRC